LKGNFIVAKNINDINDAIYQQASSLATIPWSNLECFWDLEKDGAWEKLGVPRSPNFAKLSPIKENIPINTWKASISKQIAIVNEILGRMLDTNICLWAVNDECVNERINWCGAITKESILEIQEALQKISKNITSKVKC
jgi:hypothetical protein